MGCRSTPSPIAARRSGIRTAAAKSASRSSTATATAPAARYGSSSRAEFAEDLDVFGRREVRQRARCFDAEPAEFHMFVVPKGRAATRPCVDAVDMKLNPFRVQRRQLGELDGRDADLFLDL